MSGMKHDMGGAAGMVGGFFSAVELGVTKKVTCIICLAENAIGPDAFRNDGMHDINVYFNFWCPAIICDPIEFTLTPPFVSS